MPKNVQKQDDKQERRKIERRRAKRLGINSHARAMHESYEDFGYYFMLMLMNMFEFLIKGIEKQTGLSDLGHSKKKAYSPYYASTLSSKKAAHPESAPILSHSVKPHKLSKGI